MQCRAIVLIKTILYKMYYYKTRVCKLKMFMIITLDLSPFAVRVNGHMFVVSIYFFLYNVLLNSAVKPRRRKICFDIVEETVYTRTFCKNIIYQCQLNSVFPVVTYDNIHIIKIVFKCINNYFHI